MKTTIRTEDDRAAVLAAVNALDLGKPWSVEVKKHVKKRSLNANALYWRWISIIADETGNDKDDIHEAFKAKYLEPVERLVMGEMVPVLTTANLNTREMSAYMDKVYAFATNELEMILPLPEWEHVA